MSNHTERKYLYQHTSKETAYVVQNYPWGFRLRTTIRYWIETKDAKNGGQRFASQTINPKTGQWCATKYSTYSPIMVMFLDENEHVKYYSCDHNDDEKNINQFKEKHLANLNEFQKDKLREIIAYNSVMKHVTFEVKASPIGPVNLFSKDPEEIAKREQLKIESEQREKEKEKAWNRINHAINNEYRKNKTLIV